MDEPILAWYFAGTDRRTLHGEAKLRAGATEHFEGELVLGHRGLHASRDPVDALIHGHGPIVCRVELSGARLENDTQLCTAQRTVRWMADASELLRERAREALAEHIDADLNDEAALRQLLEAAREDTEARFDRLRDGEWQRHERGQDVDLDALHAKVELARVRARLVDAAVRLCSDRFEAMRSAYEDMRDSAVAVDIRASLQELPRLRTESPKPRSHPLDPVPVRKGPLYDAREALGRELGKIGWITRAAYGVLRDGTDVLFVETKSRRNAKRKREAQLIVERVRDVIALEQLLVILDRAHGFRVDLERLTLLTDATKREAVDIRDTESFGQIELLHTPVTVHRRPARPTWKPTLKHGATIPADELLADEQRVFLGPGEDEPPTRVGNPIGKPLSPSRGLSVWRGMSAREARANLRNRFGGLGTPTPAVVIDSYPRRAVSFGDTIEADKVAAVAEFTEAWVISEGVAHWSTRGPFKLVHHQAQVHEIGRTAGYPVFVREQELALADEAISSRLRNMPWILAAWLLALSGTDGCVGIELWRTDPQRDSLGDARRLAQAWREIAGPARIVVVCREASPPRWVYVDDSGVVGSEIYPLQATMRSLCYLAG